MYGTSSQEPQMSMSPPNGDTLHRPARSKEGCLTCRRRKVRCNERRPTCAHCERLNLECKWRPYSTAHRDKRFRPTTEPDYHVPRAANPSVSQSPSPAVAESFDSLFNYASFMWDGGDIWATSPTWSGQGSQGSSDLEHSAHQRSMQNPPTFMPSNVSLDLNNTQVVQSAENALPRRPADEASGQPPLPTTEGFLIDYFAGTVVPPILAHVETQQKWSSMRQLLLSMANSSLMVRSVILAFSDLLLSRQSSSWIKNTGNHYQKALSEVAQHGDFSQLGSVNSSSRENLLATLFFLSYIDLLEDTVSGAHTNLKKAYQIYEKADKDGFRTVEVRLLSWIRLLDARAVAAGGEGLFLGDADESLLVYPSPPSTGSQDPIQAEDDPGTNMEEVLFDVLYQPGLVFFQRVQSFMGRISKIDPWHRSRGTVEDETEVMAIAAKISRDQNTVYNNRPTLMDYAVAGSLTSAHVSANLAHTVTRAFRTYLSNYHASKIHLHRVAYKTLPLTRETLNAISMIRHLTRLMVEGSDSSEMLPVNMLWPLLMWGCEENDLEEREWIKAQILSMGNVATNARITSQVLEEVQARQDATKERVDVRRVMHDVFDSCFAIV